MTEQIDMKTMSDIKSLIEENNEALRDAIRALEILNNKVLQQEQEVPPTPRMLPNYYPGYVTPARFAFMQQ